MDFNDNHCSKIIPLDLFMFNRTFLLFIKNSNSFVSRLRQTSLQVESLIITSTSICSDEEVSSPERPGSVTENNRKMSVFALNFTAREHFPREIERATKEEEEAEAVEIHHRSETVTYVTDSHFYRSVDTLSNLFNSHFEQLTVQRSTQRRLSVHQIGPFEVDKCPLHILIEA